MPAATARGVHGRQRPAVEHRLRRRARDRPAARGRPAHSGRGRSLRAGQWKRSAYTGVEIDGKTVGVVGLGRIGQLFAARMAAFDIRLIAYDPYVAARPRRRARRRLVDLTTCSARRTSSRSTCRKTPETLGLIGEDELALTKPGVLIVNAARGGLIDEEALAEAVRSGRVGGAGIDVYVTEPRHRPARCSSCRSVVVTPHLGASTDEAQDRAGTDVARSVKLALAGEFVPDAVNVQVSGVVGEEVRPWLPLDPEARHDAARAGRAGAQLGDRRGVGRARRRRRLGAAAGGAARRVHPVVDERSRS